MITQVKIEGVREISRRLEKLADNYVKRAEKAALKSGAGPILKSSKNYAQASRDTGLLTRSLGISVRKVGGNFTARVGARSGFRKVVEGKVKNPVKYSHLVELGTSRSAAKPFIRPAIESAKGEVLEAMAAGLDKFLTNECAKLKS